VSLAKIKDIAKVKVEQNVDSPYFFPTNESPSFVGQQLRNNSSCFIYFTKFKRKQFPGQRRLVNLVIVQDGHLHFIFDLGVVHFQQLSYLSPLWLRLSKAKVQLCPRLG
jgi:hypothetical protein